MTDISGNIRSVLSRLPSGVKLVAVTKTQTVDTILAACSEGLRTFGENRVQELLNKKDQLPRDIKWHLIGHLQSNKVKPVVPFISMIQSVDSFRLLQIIDNEARKINRVVDCLLQMHIASEETKFGFSMDEISEMLGSQEIKNISNVRICGLMGMATFTTDTGLVRKEFRSLAENFKVIRLKYFRDSDHFKDISMGMSGDYPIAVEEGSTIVRIGSLIFGERNKVQ
jgi:PLP dependent protein